MMKNVLATGFSSKDVMQNALATPSLRQVTLQTATLEICQNTGKPSILRDIFLKS
jgi:hypothetical protein